MQSSEEGDVNYWKQKANEYKRSWEEERDELKEFQINSKELESELEAQLEMNEKRNAELRAALERKSLELESYSKRSESNLASSSHQISLLQDELISLKSERAKQQECIRQLEQTNDDLERSNRSAAASVDDLKCRLNKLIESNALLEGEVDEKEELLISVQRLKDEVRDLNQELSVRRKVQSPEYNESTNLVDFEKLNQETQTTMISKILQTSSIHPLTPTSRLAALNLVGDLLQKVGQLEANFAQICRCYDVSPAKLAKFHEETMTKNGA